MLKSQVPCHASISEKRPGISKSRGMDNALRVSLSMNRHVDRKYVRGFDQIRSSDVPLVGGKNASLGEMIRSLDQRGIRVPDGFATTVDAYVDFLDANSLTEKIRSLLDDLKRGTRTLEKTGRRVRRPV